MRNRIFSVKIITLLFVLLFLSALSAYAQESVRPSSDSSISAGDAFGFGLQKGVAEEEIRRALQGRGYTKPGMGNLTEEQIREELERKARYRPRVPVEEESVIERYFATQSKDIKLSQYGRLTQFGYDLFRSAVGDFSPSTLAPVGPNYVVGPGDEIIIHIWGQVEDNFRMVVGRNGEITLPKLGVVHISGMALSDVKEYLTRRFSEYYMGFELDVTLGRLRVIQISVVGDVQNPGTYTLTPLSTVFHALFRCGGPTKSGTLRDIRLIRQNDVIAHIDLYQFLLKGDKSQDMRLEADDTIFVPPIGEIVAITGKVKRPGIYEIKDDSDIKKLVEMAGGTFLGGSESEVEIERIRKAHGDDSDPPPDPFHISKLKEGDFIKLTPEMVTITGEVRYPGKFIIERGERLSSVLEKAGGFTEDAYLKGAFFTRESVKKQQQQRLSQQLDRLQAEILVAQGPENEALRSYLEELHLQLKSVKLTGRVIIRLDQLDKFKDSPFDVEMEDGDTLYVPSRPATVAVMGELYNPTSIIYSPDKGLKYYLNKAGGLTPKAEKKHIYVVKADGSVIGKDQRGDLGLSWNSKLKRFVFRGSKNVMEPGDTIFVPPKPPRPPLTKNLMEFTQLLYQVTLGAGVLLAL